MPLVAVGAALAVALAGCIPAVSSKPTLDPPPTAEQLDAMLAQQSRNWWDAISPGIPMPDVAVIDELPPGAAAAEQSECLDEAGLPGVSVLGPGEWTFSGAAPNDPAYTAAQKQWWICSQQYPAQVGDYLLTPSQLDWLYDFYVERYQPCLRSFGIEMLGFPSREQFVDESGAVGWIPYEQSVRPIPTTAEWHLLAKDCPLPDLLDGYRLPGAQG